MSVSGLRETRSKSALLAPLQPMSKGRRSSATYHSQPSPSMISIGIPMSSASLAAQMSRMSRYDAREMNTDGICMLLVSSFTHPISCFPRHETQTARS